MIIVEGPDGAGKSTLVKELKEEYGFVEGLRGTNDRKLLYTVTRSDTYNALSQAVRGDGPPIIWDRLFFSEMVYAPIVHRDCEFSLHEQKFVGDVLESLECPVIVCRPPFEVVQINAAKDEQMDGVNENLRGIYQRYETECDWPHNTMWYDYTGTVRGGKFVSREDISKQINHYLAVRKWRET